MTSSGSAQLSSCTSPPPRRTPPPPQGPAAPGGTQDRPRAPAEGRPRGAGLPAATGPGLRPRPARRWRRGERATAPLPPAPALAEGPKPGVAKGEWGGKEEEGEPGAPLPATGRAAGSYRPATSSRTEPRARRGPVKPRPGLPLTSPPREAKPKAAGPPSVVPPPTSAPAQLPALLARRRGSRCPFPRCSRRPRPGENPPPSARGPSPYGGCGRGEARGGPGTLGGKRRAGFPLGGYRPSPRLPHTHPPGHGGRGDFPHG